MSFALDRAVRGGELSYFGDWARETRELRGYTTRVLADKSGYTQPYISQIEKGERNPKPDARDAICDALGAKRIDAFNAWVRDQNPPEEIVYEEDPDASEITASYGGLNSDNKEVVKLMIETMRQAERKKSIGGGAKTRKIVNGGDKPGQ